MSTVAPALSTYAYIELLVRHYTATSSASQLPASEIQVKVNNFYNQRFPNAIKTDQMRSVYTFFTSPNVDKYPLDVNYNQGIRAPFYVDGIQGLFFKDREQFFRMWPEWPTLVQPASGDGVTQVFNFTVSPTPFYQGSVTIGSVDTTGAVIQVKDDGAGNLQYLTPNAQTDVPAQNTTLPLVDPIPGMLNRNTGNPGLNAVTNMGTVNYVTGAISLDFTLAPGSPIPASGELFKIYLSQYQVGRPYCLLFWNNEFTIRPVPDRVHKLTIEAYLTPVQFMLTTDSPIMNQWVNYLALGASIQILTERQDMQGVQNLMPMFKEEEGLVLERQATEEIGQRNTTIFSSSINGQGQFWGNWGAW